ncbi:TIGR03915 family putative DNA repair protein [Slackia heliotrinireducens]|uniref:TIGR03915 family putative DNA repair protein n=1 Tax=Slackia heliotrinireducens TaxID=84110 RepID=UPI00331623DE
MEPIAYVYDDTLEGLLTAIFTAYARHEDPEDVVPAGLIQPRLGQEVVSVETDFELAERVRAGLVKTCGKHAFEVLKRVSLAADGRRGSIGLAFVRYAMNHGRQTFSNSMHPAVFDAERLVKSVEEEREKWKQFLRFSEVDGGVYVARCNPRANVVPLLMPGFAARFNVQPFMIYDEVHNLAGVYDMRRWVLVTTDAVHVPDPTLKDNLMRAAWKTFYDALSVEDRYNPELRRQLMPKRYWKYLVELKPNQAGLSTLGD